MTKATNQQNLEKQEKRNLRLKSALKENLRRRKTKAQDDENNSGIS